MSVFLCHLWLGDFLKAVGDLSGKRLWKSTQLKQNPRQPVPTTAADKVKSHHQANTDWSKPC
jgi:hypothetical protein